MQQQRADRQGAQKAAQTALDLNSVLEEANAKLARVRLANVDAGVTMGRALLP